MATEEKNKWGEENMLHLKNLYDVCNFKKMREKKNMEEEIDQNFYPLLFQLSPLPNPESASSLHPLFLDIKVI